ncbi:MAG: bifunctional phosphoglucose/phosphomannose isomerase [Anaerolineaceae bacterium]|nr:bifunctional phosphoglucose/phosphomannose isomerase [Anaerolineaceae bacterium]
MQTQTNPLDPDNMLGFIDALADDLEKAWQLGHGLPLPEFTNIEKVVIPGMGGSAIGGDLLSAYLAPSCRVPILSHRNYGLPAYAQGKGTLVICSSHSGNTEETLSSFDAALERGCQVMALCTGGELRARAEEKGLPVWVFQHSGQPRTAIPYSFGMLLALVCRLGLARVDESEIQEALSVLREGKALLSAGADLSVNPAKRLAGQLLNRNVVILAAGELEVVARRWKTQINELAKAWAVFEGLPESNHNTLAGLEFPESLFEQTSALFLRSGLDHPRNGLRLTATQQAFLMAGAGVDAVHARGQGRLAQIWSLLQFGDYVSYFLALDYGVDPTPVDALTRLKNSLAAHK